MSVDNTIFQNELKRFFNNEERIKYYREGIESLEKSGVFILLQSMGYPTIIDNGANVAIMAGQAHWSSGFLKCLERLRNFITLFNAVAMQPLQSPDFGGVRDALAKGDLRESDLK